MEVRGRRCSSREISPEREKLRSSLPTHPQHMQPRGRGVIKPSSSLTTTSSLKKVQVVYYLTKNGQLEHPHFMEVTHFSHQHLRLKDVMDRLMVLRGRTMPLLYSWSYKRSYRNGYVWNDLAENDDIISPSEGAEYVLKGSELLHNFTEKFQHQQFQAVLPDPTSFQPKRRVQPPKRHPEPEEFNNNNTYEEEEDITEEEFELKTNYTAPNTPYSRCSIGVSTDEIQLDLQNQQLLHKPPTHKNPSSTESTQHNSPPSATSSTVSDKTANENNSKDGDSVVTESVLSRNSVLYSLIACGGGSVSFRGKSSSKVPVLKEEEVEARKSGGLRKSAAATTAEEVEEIRCMSENPRFGNMQAEEKEYFSGSIVEAICEDDRVKGEANKLMRSNSYNEQRCSKGDIDMAKEEEEEVRRKDRGVKGKCISMPRKSSTSSSSCFSYLM